MPIEHVISLEYLTYYIVLHCVLAALCQLLLNEYCIVLYNAQLNKNKKLILMLTNPLDAFRGQSRSANIVPFVHSIDNLPVVQ